MNEIKVEQLSDEWFKLRLGKITASKFSDIMKTPKQRLEWSQTQTTILLQIASELLTGEREASFTSKSMEWGINTESEARDYYSIVNDVLVRESGFFVTSEYIGGSPDGIASDGLGCLEIKCPNSKQHLKYLLDIEELKKAYKWQALGHIYNTGLNWCDLVSYDPRFKDDDKKMVIYRYNREEYMDDLRLLDKRLDEAITIIMEWVNA